MFVNNRNENVYLVDLDSIDNSNVCLDSLDDDSWLWHGRLGHKGMKQISFAKNKLIRGLPKIKFEKDYILVKSRNTLFQKLLSILKE